MSIALSSVSTRLVFLSERISNEDFLAVMEEAFRRGQKIRFSPSGSSMLPMLDGKEDTVTFAPPPEKLKKYDVAFYRREKTGQLVLHRVVRVKKDGSYVFCGDGQYSYEPGITQKDILAFMEAFTHKGKAYSVTDFSYRFYIQRMMFKKRLRMLAVKVYHKLFKRH